MGRRVVEPADDTKKKPTLRQRLDALGERRREILAGPAQEALDMVLQAPQPAALVHSFPAQDLYLLIHDIGLEDALPVLALASDHQREFILDLEVWRQDRLSTAGFARWLRLMLAADPKRLVPWLAENKTELFEHFLLNNIEVRIREHDQDASEFGPGFFTHDDVFYVRVLDTTPPGEDGLDEARLKASEQREMIVELLQRLALWDYPKYQAILLEATSLIPAEVEEEEYRLRNIRLAENGFLPFEEAVGVYQPLTAEALAGRSRWRAPTHAESGALFNPPAQPVVLAEGGSLFSDALAIIEPGVDLDGLQAEFAVLCNRVIVADQRRVRDKEDLRGVVRKVCATISIGLEAAGGGDAARAARLVRRHSLTDIFRVGFGGSLRLKWRAQRWLHDAWFKRSGLPLTFWDEEWTGFLGGLLLKKPLCYDPAGVERRYREFESSDDIRRAAAVLDEVSALDGLLAALAPEIDPALASGALSYKNLLLTLWSLDRLGCGRRGAVGAPLLERIGLDRFRHFFQELFPKPSGGAEGRRIPEVMKRAFFAWLASAAGREPAAVGETVGAALERLFGELEAELGRVDVGNVDPRFIRLFLIERAP